MTASLERPYFKTFDEAASLVLVDNPMDDTSALEHALFMAGLTVWTLGMMIGSVIGQSFPAEIHAIIIAAAVVVGSAFIASLRRLALLLVRLAESWGRHRVRKWAEARGIDPSEILED